MRILAFNTTHDSSVCCLNNGKIEFFCKEERLTRVKRDRNPFKSLQLFQSQNKRKIDHILFCTPSNRGGDMEFFYFEYIKKLFNMEMENFSSLTHHLCHASSAFYNSGFKEALSIVIDRNGSIVFENSTDSCREAESVFVFNYPSDIKILYKSFWTNNFLGIDKHTLLNHTKAIYPDTEINIDNEYSITKVYEAATTLIGQNILENGKTMGLSAYGINKNYEPLFLKGNPITNYFNHKFLDNDNVVTFNGLEDKITKDLSEDNFQLYADKAKHVQLETQKQSLEMIKKYVEETQINNVCVSGGYGLNVVANNYYKKNLPNINFYFEPLSDDTGISIGAAYLKYRDITQDKVVKKPKDNFYHYYKPTALNKGVTHSIKDVSQLLINKKSVGIFYKSPEAGPRALGNRSILFDARNKNSKKLINKIKQREWYRPFAGVILQEYFKDYFETLGLTKSEDMTINFDCKQITKKLVPGIVHVDGTCRVQTVDSGFLYDLLKVFYKQTGCPILLNTSLNLAGEPLVQTKDEAFSLFKNSKLDTMYFVDERKLISK